MREIVPRLWDDLSWTRQHAKVEATDTIAIGLDGAWAELDLTERNAESIRDSLRDWMAAGRRVDAKDVRPPRKRAASAKASIIAYNRLMREFGTERGLEWHKSGSTYKHSRELQEAYAAYLAEQEG
jgi:hypothetical protein